jgi:hypothetical protein
MDTGCASETAIRQLPCTSRQHLPRCQRYLADSTRHNQLTQPATTLTRGSACAQVAEVLADRETATAMAGELARRLARRVETAADSSCSSASDVAMCAGADNTGSSALARSGSTCTSASASLGARRTTPGEVRPALLHCARDVACLFCGACLQRANYHPVLCCVCSELHTCALAITGAVRAGSTTVSSSHQETRAHMQVLQGLSPAMQSAVFAAFRGGLLQLFATLPPQMHDTALATRARGPGHLDLSRLGQCQAHRGSLGYVAMAMSGRGQAAQALRVVDLTDAGLGTAGARAFAPALSAHAPTLQARAAAEHRR